LKSILFAKNYIKDYLSVSDELSYALNKLNRYNKIGDKGIIGIG